MRSRAPAGVSSKKRRRHGSGSRAPSPKSSDPRRRPMRAWHVWRLKIRALFRGGSVDRDDRDEMQAHLEYLTQEYIEQGLAPEEARRRARHDFGGIAQLEEASRDARGVRWVHDGIQDGRYAVRLL